MNLKDRRESIRYRIKRIAEMLEIDLRWGTRSSLYEYNHTLMIGEFEYFQGGWGTFHKFAEFEAYIGGLYEGCIRMRGFKK